MAPACTYPRPLAPLAPLALARSGLLAALFGASIVAGCDARYPDGKYACDRPADCPGDDFHACRLGENGSGQKRCFRLQLESRKQPSRTDPGDEPTPDVVHRDAGEHPDDGSTHGGSGMGPPVAGAGSEAAAPMPPPAESPSDAASDAGSVADAPETPRFEVVTSKPTEGGTLEDPTAGIVLRFSQAVFASTLTSATVRVDGGSAKFELSGDGTALTILPPTRWRLSDSYEVELSSSILSQDLVPLPPTRLRFRVRDGRWSTATAARAETNTRVSDPYLTTSEAGDLALAWTILYGDMRAPSARAVRRAADGSWQDVAVAAGSGGHTGLVYLFESLVFGHQANDASPLASLTCLAPDGTTWTVDLAPPAPGQRTRIDGLTQGYAQLSVLVANLDPNPPAPYSVVTAHCDDFSSPRVWLIPSSPGAAVVDVVFQDDRTVAWTERSPANPSTSVWATRDSSVAPCMGEDGCPEQVSAPERAADSVARAEGLYSSHSALLWRQSDDGASSIWAQTSTDQTLPVSRPISEPSAGPARAPRIVWSEDERFHAVWLQGPPDALRVTAAVFAENAWSAPSAVSTGFAEDTAIEPELAFDPAANGFVVWAQPAVSGGYDVRALGYGREADAWGRDVVTLSTQPAADPRASLVMDVFGRAYVAWSDAEAIWVARYE